METGLDRLGCVHTCITVRSALHDAQLAVTPTLQLTVYPRNSYSHSRVTLTVNTLYRIRIK